ncbi:MAG TPA: hypothetical protein VK360_01105 [Acidimicrobiales bacterium]|nr:hypothetical protein [Acidimicrobiales bacterium]
MDVGDHRGLRHPRVDDHDRARPVGPEHPGGEQRVVVGDVRAPQHDHVRLAEVVIAARRAVGAEAQLVAGHGAGHAQRGVAVVVGEAHAEPDELAEGVELLGDELTGRQHGH